MNIGFEAKRIFSNYTGLGNYGRFVVSALSTYYPDHSYFLYTPKFIANREVEPYLIHRNIEIIEPRGGYRAFSSLWRTWAVGFEGTIKQLDVFHGLSQELPYHLAKGIKKIVTVHDLIFLRFPKFYKSIDVSIYKTKVTHACRQADVIIAISEQTRQDLIDYLKVNPKKIVVIYQGCHPNFKQKVTAEGIALVKKKYQLPDQYILNVGTIEERKNILVLIRALALVPKSQRLPVVVVGKQTEYFDKVKEEAVRLGVIDDLQFLHNARFADFPTIYHGATVFVYPSLFEGFGIPLIEAIESGIPVITSKGSCFSEAAGPASVYVDPKNFEELAQQLTRVTGSEAIRKEMIKKSREYISRFSGEIISKQIFDIYTT
jgi:glycosyltransferase involved in cell wall biosynthesis